MRSASTLITLFNPCQADTGSWTKATMLIDGLQTQPLAQRLGVSFCEACLQREFDGSWHIRPFEMKACMAL